MQHIPERAVLLDIGCHEGQLLKKVSKKILKGTGVDPLCSTKTLAQNISIINGRFPEALPNGNIFSCITVLAVFEHIPPAMQQNFLKHCYSALENGGLLILTIPGKKVDSILQTLKRYKLISGMSLEEHHGYDPFNTLPLGAKAGFRLVLFEQFEMGYNNLFVFLKP